MSVTTEIRLLTSCDSNVRSMIDLNIDQHRNVSADGKSPAGQPLRDKRVHLFKLPLNKVWLRTDAALRWMSGRSVICNFEASFSRIMIRFAHVICTGRGMGQPLSISTPCGQDRSYETAHDMLQHGGPDTRSGSSGVHKVCPMTDVIL